MACPVSLRLSPMLMEMRFHHCECFILDSGTRTNRK
jgi:hypothetical protein